MAVMDADTSKLLNYRQLMRSMKYREAWSFSSANEFGRLANGIGGRIKNSTNIHRVHMPTQSTNRTDERHHIWAIRVHGATRKGGTQLNAVHCRGRQNQLPRRSCHPNSGNAGGKMLFNSAISTKDARFMTMDISNFYLMTPLHRPEFI
jgi:hypothetical protein